MRQLRFVCLLVVACGGCGDGDREHDGGTDAGEVANPDTGVRRDSGPRDSGGSRSCMPPMSECDILEQDCEAGQACRNLSPGEGMVPRGLCEAAGTRMEGMECTRSDTMPDPCAEGMICTNGFCRRYCCDGNTEDCMDSTGDRVCQSFADTIVGICVPCIGCTLVPQSGCAADLGCYPLGHSGCATCLAPNMRVEPGGACTYANDCRPGAICVADVCREFCDPAVAMPCMEEGFGCNPVNDASGPLPGVGICVPPA